MILVCVVFCVGVCQLLLSNVGFIKRLCLTDGSRLISSGKHGRITIWDIKVTPLVVQWNLSSVDMYHLDMSDYRGVFYYSGR